MQNFQFENKTLKAHKIDLHGSALMVIEGEKGFLGCGYINVDVADKLNHAAAIVTGVKDLPDMLKAKVSRVSAAAEKLGVKVGMTGSEALEKLI